MDKFKVDNLVRVKPKFWDAQGHKHEVGIVVAIIRDPEFPYVAEFNGKREVFAEDALEKI